MSFFNYFKIVLLFIETLQNRHSERIDIQRFFSIVPIKNIRSIKIAFITVLATAVPANVSTAPADLAAAAAAGVTASSLERSTVPSHRVATIVDCLATIAIR